MEDAMPNGNEPTDGQAELATQAEKGDDRGLITRRNFLGIAGAGVVGATLGSKLLPQSLMKRVPSTSRLVRNTASTTNLTFWNSFTASDRPFVEAIVAKYNASQSKVHIDMTIMPGDVLQEKLLVSLGTGTGPNISTAPEALDKQYRSSLTPASSSPSISPTARTESTVRCCRPVSSPLPPGEANFTECR